MTSKKAFLTTEVLALLNDLTPDQEPNFGLMTAQHMVEHLAMIIKISVKRYGTPENPPTKGQLGFKKFIANGAVFQHRPSNKTKGDLPPLKYNSLAAALAQIPIATKRFYDHYEANSDFKAYSPFMGELSFEELELFHYMHCRYHCWQFGLIESYD